MAKIGGGYSSQDTSSQFQNSGTTSGTTSGTGTTAAIKTPDQMQSGADIFAALHKYLSDPNAAVNPSRVIARNQVNQNYSGLADRTRQKFLTTGGGQSGKMGQAMLAGEVGRSGGLANVDMAAQEQAAQLPMTAAQLAEAFLGINMGQTTTGNTTTAGLTTNQGTGSGNQSGWGVNASAGISGGDGGGGSWKSYGG